MVKIIDLEKKLAELGDKELRLEDLEMPSLPTLSPEYLRWEAEKNNLPFQARDNLVELNRQVAEMRTENERRDQAARTRDRLMLALTAAIFVLTALLVVDVFR
jgi:hypothetical protein